MATDPDDFQQAFIVDVCSNEQEASTLVDINIKEDLNLGLGYDYTLIKKILDRSKYYGKELKDLEKNEKEEEFIFLAEEEEKPEVMLAKVSNGISTLAHFEEYDLMKDLEEGKLWIAEVECIKEVPGEVHCGLLATKGYYYEVDLDEFGDSNQLGILSDIGSMYGIGQFDSEFFNEHFRISSVEEIE